MLMFCMKCGSQIPDGSKFCPYCGYDGKDSAPAQPAAKSPAPTPEAKQPVKSAKKEQKPKMTIIPAEPAPVKDDSKWWIWLIVFVVCAALLAGIFLLGNNYIDYSDLASLSHSPGTHFLSLL